jgi:predicted HTH domain antitoxin
MRTAEIRFDVQEDILNTLNQNVNEFTMQLRLYAALQLFKKHKLSFGKAAELAGISRDEFLIELDKNEIDFIDYEPSELERELERFQHGHSF